MSTESTETATAPETVGQEREASHKPGGAGLRETISQAYEKVRSGESLVAVDEPEVTTPAEPEVEPDVEPEAEAESPSLEEPDQPEEEVTQSRLPSGWTRDEKGKIHRPDGSYASKDQVAAIEAGEDPLSLAVSPEDAAEEEPEAVDQPEDELEEEPEVEFQTVKLPGRNPDDDDEEWEIADPELAERINQLRNGYMRGEEAKRQISQAQKTRQEATQMREELEYVYESLAVDPINFVMDQVANDDIRKRLAVHLLTDKDVFQAVAEEFDGKPWESPEMRARRSELELERRSLKDKAVSAREKARIVNNQTRTVLNVLRDLAAQVPERQAKSFGDLSIQQIQKHLSDNKMDYLDDAERDVVAILQRNGTLAAFGVDPSKRSSQDSQAPVQSQGGDSEGGAAKPAAPAQNTGSAASRTRTPVRARKGGRTADQLTAAKQKRQEAAATTRGGQGAAPTVTRPPEGQDVKERIKWWKNRR